MRFSLGRYGEAAEGRLQSLVAAGASGRIWRRDATFWGADADRVRSAGNRLGWLTIAEEMQARVGEIRRFAEAVRDASFTDAVLLGMGGSSLAPEVLRQCAPRDERYPALHVLDTTDPASILEVRNRIDAARTLFFVSSKSGSTIEPLSLFAYFREVVERVAGDRWGEQFVAITDAGTSLEALARESSFRRLFTNPGDIGGRYSALSYFGLVPAAVSGVDVAPLVERAVAAARRAEAADGDALRLGAALGQLALDGRDKCTFVLSPRIAALGLWLEQLIAESTGKEQRGIVPVVREPLGTPSRYGDDRVFVQIRVEGGEEAENDAGIGALGAEGHPAIVIDIESALDLGAQFFEWEFAVAVAGQVLGINPFDEPNVQESKDNTSSVLAAFDREGTLDVRGLDAQVRAVPVSERGIDPAPLSRAIGALLAEVRPGDYVALTAYVRQDHHADLLFDEMRALIRDQLRSATTLGYGPRFLHSTGQLHKGGAPNGVFLQITQNDAADVAVPGRSFTFGQLKRAQSIGDYDSLKRSGRPLLRVHLGDDVAAGLIQLRDAVHAAVSAVPNRS